MPNLQDKLDKVARAVEPILWNILDEIENDKGDWVCTITGEVMDDFGNIIDEDCDYCEAGIAENHNHESEK
jgi:hypothetical protein